MTNPLDNSDLASLIQADWHEEFGDIDYANEIRESVLEPQINQWHWSDNIDNVGKGVGVVGSAGSAGGSCGAYDCVGGVGGASIGGDNNNCVGGGNI